MLRLPTAVFDSSKYPGMFFPKCFWTRRSRIGGKKKRRSLRRLLGLRFILFVEASESVQHHRKKMRRSTSSIRRSTNWGMFYRLITSILSISFLLPACGGGQTNAATARNAGQTDTAAKEGPVRAPSHDATQLAPKNAESAPEYVQTWNKRSAPFLWRVDHENGASYLLGTIHLGVDPDEVFSADVWNTVEKSRVVAFEADVDAMQKNPQALLQLALLAPDLSLSKMLGSKHWKTLKEELPFMPAQSLDRMRPWFAHSLLLAKTMEGQLAKGENGSPQEMPMIDATILEYAKRHEKKLAYLEDWKDAAETMDKAMTIDSLKKRLDEGAELGEEAKALMAAYRDGDEKALEKLILRAETKSEKESLEIILFDRNKLWLSNVQALLDEGNAFIAVGAGHLIGDRSLVELLKKNGYKISRVDRLPHSD